MGANSLPKTVTQQHRDCDLNPGPSAPKSSMHSATKPPMSDGKTNFRLFIYSLSSTNPANMVQIGIVNVEMIGLTEMVKKETKA